MSWAWGMIWVEEKYRVLVEKYEGKEQLGRVGLHGDLC
jgi:hypothetical protein